MKFPPALARLDYGARRFWLLVYPRRVSRQYRWHGCVPSRRGPLLLDDHRASLPTEGLRCYRQVPAASVRRTSLGAGVLTA
jgi:hypothetical protein